MSQKEIEVILTRQLASYLALPIFIVDPQGTLVFYNEPAEAILGLRFDETGEMAAAEWGTVFTPIDGAGSPLPPDTLPLTIALRERRSAHGDFYIRGLDLVLRHIEVTAFPLIGQAHRDLGAVALFWEVHA
ncbi:MAG: PAS domain-containing protein [Deltaproteobacteria bacterium]|nr:PAS domain-containing protein [Deltaproteobacteria bacterium]